MAKNESTKSYEKCQSNVSEFGFRSGTNIFKEDTVRYIKKVILSVFSFLILSVVANVSLNVKDFYVVELFCLEIIEQLEIYIVGDGPRPLVGNL